MKAQDLSTGLWKYFVDKCLPFGASISCSHFQCFSDALRHLIECRINGKDLVTNYLDDYLSIALSILACNNSIQEFLDLCDELNIPVSFEKTEWASEMVVFLGILMNGRDLVLCLPLEKRKKAISLLESMIGKKSSTVRDLQGLCGYLNFLCKAVVPRRCFTRRMYAKYSNLVNIKGAENRLMANTFKIKQHHHFKLDREFKLDCKVWLDFLTTPELQGVVNRKMIDVKAPVLTSREICFYSDASKSKKLGFGCILDKRWIYSMWEQYYIEKFDPSIEYLELFALCAGVFTWESEKQMRDSKVTIFCDNMAVVHMINKGSSGCKNCMVLLQLLTLNN